MAVSEQTPYIEYVSDGANTVFPLTFDCEKSEFLIVKINGEDAAIGSWLLDNNNVVLNYIPSSGVLISIERNTPFERTTNYQLIDSSFAPKPVNTDFDKVWLKLQELGFNGGRLLDKLIQESLDRINSNNDLQQDYINRDVSVKNYTDQMIALITGDPAFTGVTTEFVTQNGISQQNINLSIINYVNPKMFGAVGDGVADDAQPIRDCFNYMLANDAIFYDYSNSAYKFNSDILVSAPNKRIDIQTNCTFISDTSLFKIAGTIEELGSLTSAAAKGSLSINASFSVQVGDVVALHNTVNKSFAQHRDYYTDGEFKTVASVSAGVITFTQPLETSYGGVSTDKVYKINPVYLNAKGLTVQSDGAGAFNLSLAYNSDVDINVYNLANASNSNHAMQFDRVYNSKISGGEYIKRGVSGTGTDYGIGFANCQDIKNNAKYAYGGRHGVSTGGTALLASVPCRRIVTDGAKIENDPLSNLHAADFHGNTVDSMYTNCLIYGRISLSGMNTSSRFNKIHSHAGDVRTPIGYSEVVGGVLESVGDTILSSAAASNIAGWLTSSEIVNTVKPTTFKLQDIKFNGNANLIGILSAFNMAVDFRVNIDGFELTDSSNTITRLVTYTAGSQTVKPSYIQITRPNYAVPDSIILIAGDAGLAGVRKQVFSTSGSNENGTWIRNSDGSMECSFRVATTLPITTTVSGGYKSTDIQWTYPKAFISQPRLSPMIFDNASMAIRGTSAGTSSAQLHSFSTVSVASAGINFDITAKGRFLY